MTWKAGKITQTEQQKENHNLKNEDSLRDLWDNMKYTNTGFAGVPEGEEGERKGQNVYLKR